MRSLTSSTRVVVLIVLLVLYCHCAALQLSSYNNNNTCDTIIIIDKQCCEGVRARVDDHFTSVVSSVVIGLQSVVNESQTQLKHVLRSLLSASRDKTRATLDGSDARSSVDALFAHMWKTSVERDDTREVISREGAEEEATEERVKQLFEMIFIYELENTRKKTFSKKRRLFSKPFVDCLRTLYSEYNYSPFGPQMPRIIIQPLQRALQSISLVMRALSLTAQVLQTSAHHVIEVCSQVWTRSVVCDQCVVVAHGNHHNNNNTTVVEWCRASCVDAMQTCLSPPLITWWTRFVTSLEAFSASLVGHRNPQTLFTKLDQLFAEALTHMRQRRHETAQKVRIGCGHPKRYLRDTTTADDNGNHTAITDQSHSSSSSSSSSVSFFVRLQTFVHEMATQKHLFSHLSQLLCQQFDDTTTTHDNNNECRHYNRSEHIRDDVIDSKVTPLLVERLMKTSELMDSLIVAPPLVVTQQQHNTNHEYLMDEEEVVESSGSGGEAVFTHARDDGLTDDEDYVWHEQGSGSGGSDSDTTSDITTATHVRNEKRGGATHVTCSGGTTAVAVVAVCAMVGVWGGR